MGVGGFELMTLESQIHTWLYLFSLGIFLSQTKMASSSTFPRKVGAAATPVNELIQSSYVSSSVVVPLMKCPVIEFQRLLDVSSPACEQELLKLNAAITSWGCFQLVNHGVTTVLIDQVHSVGKKFFALQPEEKYKYSVGLYEGYGDGQSINWSERLRLKTHPVEQRNFKLWPGPDIVPNFRQTLHDYSRETKEVLEVMLKAIAESLKLEENIFLNQFGEDGSLYVRYNYYPPVPNPDEQFGLRPHSDGTLLTILLQDKQVEGLQVFQDNQWYKAPIIPDALFINIGDQLEILSNGILKSPIHKAVTNKKSARMSVTITASVHDDKEIGPLSELIDEDRPKLYKNVKNYLALPAPSYARRERPIDNLKIQQ